MMRIARRGRVTVKLRSGEALPEVAAHRDVRRGYAAPSLTLDRGGPIDRALKRRSSAVLASRAYYARQSLGSPGAGHLDWDDLEESLGLSRTFRVHLSPDADVKSVVHDLRSLRNVESATAQYVVSARSISTEELFGEDEARDLIGADAALEREPGDTALIMGLIDSGVDLTHSELQGRLRPGISSVGLKPEEIAEGVVVVEGMREDVQDVDDDEGHGTACAGILCANGYRIPRGMAGASRLLPVRALCGARIEGEGLTAMGAVEDINSGWKTALDLGARVLNLSFGTPESLLEPGDEIPHADMVQYSLARGAILVAASGNSGTPDPHYPAALPGVLAVGAVDASGKPASFTTRGAYVAISAPGVRVATTERGDTYTRTSGTSFAAPLVTGVCALLVARAARMSIPLEAEIVRELIMESARPFGDRRPVEGCGRGVLDAPGALRALDRRLARERSRVAA